MKNILITGTAGFIGFHAAKEFLRRGWNVVGIDNFNDYYDIRLKLDRDELLRKDPGCGTPPGVGDPLCRWCS